MYTDGDNMKDNHFFSQNGFHSEMFYQRIYILKKCTLLSVAKTYFNQSIILYFGKVKE